MRIGTTLVALLVSAACPASLRPCESDADCEGIATEGAEFRCHQVERAPDGELTRLCAAPCLSGGDNCDDDQVCLLNRCTFEDLVPAPDAGPVDAGVDAGGPTDGGFEDGGATDSGPTDGGFDGGAECNDTAPCPTVADGTNTCVDGVCQLTCDDHFDECTPGSCVSIATVSRCGACDNDVTGAADSCAGGVARCGDADAGPCSAPTPLCLMGEIGAACFECDDNSDCDGDAVCCAGTCRAEGEDVWCGCEADPAVANLGADCAGAALDRVCVSGTCGCENSGDDECGTDDAGLVRLCDDTLNECVDQGTAQCGAVGGVRAAAALDAGVVVGGTCDAVLGGALCVGATVAPFGACGCAVDGDCTQAVLGDDGLPHVVADDCAGDACVCQADGTACPADALDCAGAFGCVDLHDDVANCGVPNNNCLNDATGIPGTGDCVEAGCLCDGNPDCAIPANVDICSVVASQQRCVCADFRPAAGSADRVACPAGLSCVSGGCEYGGTPYGDLPALLDAMLAP